jgi:hypothetical protein
MPRVSTAARPSPQVIAARSGDMIGILSGPQAAASTVAHTSIMAVIVSALSRTWPLLIRWTTVAMVSWSLTATALTAWMTSSSVTS